MGNSIRWTAAQFESHLARLVPQPAPKPKAQPQQPAPTKRAKYGSKKVEQDGIVFDSKKEARRWGVLNQMLRAGQISDLKRQVPFVLAPAVHLAGEKRKKPALRYFADFTFVQDGVLIVQDVKSTPTRKLEAFRMKKHLMATVHNLQITEI